MSTSDATYILEDIYYPINNISDEAHQTMLDKPIEHMKHKSSLDHKEIPYVSKPMTKDVEVRYRIPLTVE